MASTKSSTKSSPAKRPAAAPAVVAIKEKAPAKTKLAAKAEPAAKPKVAAKQVMAAKSGAPKATAKVAPTKEVGSRAKKPAGIPPEQRRHYVEMAAYYIAERRRFAPGNPLQDWVQAEAEIDRLLAEGRLGG